MSDYPVAENLSSFTPACDVIMDAKAIGRLPEILQFSKTALRILKAGLVLSLIYNTIGLGFAITGQLTPLVAAILMPLSSISMVLFTGITVQFIAKKRGLL